MAKGAGTHREALACGMAWRGVAWHGMASHGNIFWQIVREKNNDLFIYLICDRMGRHAMSIVRPSSLAVPVFQEWGFLGGLLCFLLCQLRFGKRIAKHCWQIEVQIHPIQNFGNMDMWFGMLLPRQRVSLVACQVHLCAAATLK